MGKATIEQDVTERCCHLPGAAVVFSIQSQSLSQAPGCPKCCRSSSVNEFDQSHRRLPFNLSSTSVLSAENNTTQVNMKTKARLPTPGATVQGTRKPALTFVLSLPAPNQAEMAFVWRRQIKLAPSRPCRNRRYRFDTSNFF